MSEQSQHTITGTKDGKWKVSQSIEIPTHGPVSGQNYQELENKFKQACIPPVIIEYGSKLVGSKFSDHIIKTLTLHAEYKSEKESQSKETADAFEHSAINVLELLKRYLPPPTP
ncbi:MAG: hypothetical protein ABSA16_11255 [Thermoguttaceae bacterium]